MARLFLLFLIAALVYLVLRLFPPSRRPPAVPPAAASSKLVGCAHCGLRVPEAEAVRQGGRYYCDRSHVPGGGGASPA